MQENCKLNGLLATPPGKEGETELPFRYIKPNGRLSLTGNKPIRQHHMDGKKKNPRAAICKEGPPIAGITWDSA